MNKKIVAALLLAVGVSLAYAKGTPVVGTGDYVVTVAKPAYKKEKGPRVLIDESHNNYQTMGDRFKGFADLMAADGARVGALREPISAKALADADILVICNALNAKNAEEKKTLNKWMNPAPEALSDAEIAALVDWVKGGGSLLLIADHMPFPSAVEKLADALGIVMQSNFAFDASFTYRPGDMNLMRFERKPTMKTGKLYAHPAVDGIKEGEHVPFVVSFTGSAFRVKPGVKFAPVMGLGAGTKTAWPSDHVDISPKTPFAAGDGLYQGAVLRVGRGKVAVFGEASMFSVNYAEWANNYPTGFHSPDAPHNKQFALNVMRWLGRK